MIFLDEPKFFVASKFTHAMKFFFLFILWLPLLCSKAQEPLIHSHNDYVQAEPLENALRNKAFSIEADVYPGNNLPVAHDKKDIDPEKTLVNMYLLPLIHRFEIHGERVSDDTAYAPVLMIDIKESSNAVIATLIKLLSLHPGVFDRSVNPNAVQIVISGDRGPTVLWKTYPGYISFDGRPNEMHDRVSLDRVFFVSDSYANYFSYDTAQTRTNIEELVAKVHAMGKRLRLWATPDNADGWKMLHKAGVDIINTDKVSECRKLSANNNF